MLRQIMQGIVIRSITTVCFILINTTSTAADATLSAYLGIPFGGGSPFFGVSTKLDTKTAPNSEVDLTNSESRMELDLRHNVMGDTVYSINGVTINNSLLQPIFNNVNSTGTQNNIDWMTIVGATLSIALCTALVVAAVDSSNSNFSFCSGTNCPPEEQPPPEPEPEPANSKSP